MNGIDLVFYGRQEKQLHFMAADMATQEVHKKVTVTRGTCYQYSDYGYGSYLTYQIYGSVW